MSTGNDEIFEVKLTRKWSEKKQKNKPNQLSDELWEVVWWFEERIFQTSYYMNMKFVCESELTEWSHGVYVLRGDLLWRIRWLSGDSRLRHWDGLVSNENIAYLIENRNSCVCTVASRRGSSIQTVVNERNCDFKPNIDTTFKDKWRQSIWSIRCCNLGRFKQFKVTFLSVVSKAVQTMEWCNDGSTVKDIVPIEQEGELSFRTKNSLSCSIKVWDPACLENDR